MWSERHAAALAAVFESLDQEGLRWMVLRNYEGLPHSNRSKDIDLVMSKHDFRAASAVLIRSLRAQGFTNVLVEQFQYVACHTFMRLQDGDLISLKIDLLDGFVWRGAQIFHFDELYERRRSYGGFSIPDAVDDAFMLWVKPLMTGGMVKSRYAADILGAIKAHPSRFQELLLAKFGERVAHKAWALLSCGSLQATVHLQQELRMTAWLRAIATRPASTLAATLEHTFVEVWRRLRRPRGSICAVVGPDGVGKSTFIELLTARLCELTVKDRSAAVVQHFRPHLLPNLKDLFSPRTPGEPAEEFTKPHRASPAGNASSLLRLGYYWVDYVCGYWLRIRFDCVRGKLYVFDRYFYDFLVDPRRSRISLPLPIRRAFLAVTPEPDLVFFLDCDPDVVFSRKQELTRDEIDRQLREYRVLSRAAKSRFVQLDALRAPGEIAETAVKQLLEVSCSSITKP